MVEGKKYNCRSPFAAGRTAVLHSDGASYAGNFFATLLGSKLWLIIKKHFFSYLHFCLHSTETFMHTFLAIRVSVPSVVDSGVPRVVSLEAGGGEGGVGYI